MDVSEVNNEESDKEMLGVRNNLFISEVDPEHPDCEFSDSADAMDISEVNNEESDKEMPGMKNNIFISKGFKNFLINEFLNQMLSTVKYIQVF